MHRDYPFGICRWFGLSLLSGSPKAKKWNGSDQLITLRSTLFYAHTNETISTGFVFIFAVTVFLGDTWPKYAV
ncbi:hypothetical protein BDV59DRAFT_167168, partial [Aspergillus ambiguus]|uniref:uncharacterized protein n=1 Tax=Aspergillus ambiguus TaxID=176160 RepID=UPI003CCCFD46